ncbi:5'-methylthioadenosine/S-adenosylhomocysteine nucleosidase [compost metagenome]
MGSLKKKNEIKKNLETVVMVDMEACSIAYICQKNHIKFTVIKTVADTVKADIAGQYKDYVQSSTKKCAEIISFIGH